ncbi:hypothetical protein H2199_006598 [Coniosporium tulheliwenetii]|uniref:Uncharacterized protein n=1 Tax=Coniosporium tulheliwenetii TaxID=3383036 RepID=A0ACC2YW04_9PEZI|nr:hypothetical protein H2199_006598 [Cladosporium sp. JES 115]
MPISRSTADAALEPPNRHAFIGNASNFWLHSARTGFDLTRPGKEPSDRLAFSRLQLLLSPAFGRFKGAGHAAAEKLLEYAIPAARKAGIQIIWLNWGLSDEDLQSIPPAVKRAFGFEAVPDDVDDGDDEAGGIPEVGGRGEVCVEKPSGHSVDRHGDLRRKGGHRLLENGKDSRIYKGLGAPCGTIILPETGETVDAGRLLMRDTWNAALYAPLAAAYEEGSKLSEKPDVWIHKNRLSGLWGGTTPCQEFLEEQGIKSLLFAGVNTDQCVSGTVTDAFNKGYDCVLLSDGCGTTSPSYAQQCIEFNVAKTLGFVTSCRQFAEGVEQMGP